jgi:hypothetical protein
MANVPISGLPLTTSVCPTALVPIVQNGVTCSTYACLLGSGGGGGGAVTQITAGSGITISPACGVGNVTICSNGGGGGLTSVGLTMPSAFCVCGSPLTSNGTICVSACGTAAQLISGCGSLISAGSGISIAGGQICSTAVLPSCGSFATCVSSPIVCGTTCVSSPLICATTFVCTPTLVSTNACITALSTSGCAVCVGIGGLLTAYTPISGGVTQICGGTGVTISPACGTGIVTICSAGGGGGIIVLGSGNCSTLRCGVNNTASGNYSFAGGGLCNNVAGTASVVVSGCCNTISNGSGSSELASILGGGLNSINSTAKGATSNYSTIVSGACNTIIGSAACSAVLSGACNIVCGNNTLVAGGCGNTASAISASVSGGIGNLSCGNYSYIGGGKGNTASGLYAIVNGGLNNVACGNYSFVAGGGGNTASGLFSGAFGCNLNACNACTFYVNNFCSCGISSSATCGTSPIYCGTTCVASPLVCGTTSICSPLFTGATHCGTTCVASPLLCGTTSVCTPTLVATNACVTALNTSGCAVCVGASGLLTAYTAASPSVMTSGTGCCSIIGSGLNNTACGLYSASLSGVCNFNCGCNSIIVGGSCNIICCTNPAYGIGNSNHFIGGGCNNCIISNCNSTIGGGIYNKIIQQCCGIYGNCNGCNTCGATISGGYGNSSQQNWSFIGGGFQNANFNQPYSATNCLCNKYGVIGGGFQNFNWGGGIFAGCFNVTYVDSFILGGSRNCAFNCSIVIGGLYNCAGANGNAFQNSFCFNTIINGSYNCTFAKATTILNGDCNTIGFLNCNQGDGSYSTVGGFGNCVGAANYAFIYGCNLSAICCGVCGTRPYDCTIFGNNIAACNLINTCFQGNAVLVDNYGRIQQGFSDSRMKESVQTLNYGLNEINLLNPISYCWKDEYSYLGNGRKLGFIAQEIKEIIPESVGMSLEGLYTFNPDVIIPILTKSVQEQQKEIQELKDRLLKLEEKLGI